MKQVVAVLITVAIMVVLLKIFWLVMAGVFALARLIMLVVVGYLVYQVVIRVLKDA